jgi:hypothetical protein
MQDVRACSGSIALSTTLASVLAVSATPPVCVPAGGQGQNRNLSARLAQLDDQVSRQQELLYSVDFQLQEMERKVGAGADDDDGLLLGSERARSSCCIVSMVCRLCMLSRH